MRCSKCRTESTSGRKFCPECGSPLSKRCAKCGAQNSPTAKFCEDCGAPLQTPAVGSTKTSNDAPIRVADPSNPENLEGERKTVTALFADIKGSMERMQDEMRRFADRLRAEKGVNLQVRVGANVGEVVVRSIQIGQSQVEYTPIGHSISLASRLQTLANPGSVAISDGLHKLVEGFFTLKALGPARIKGSSEPVNVYEVLGLGPLRTRLQRAAGRGLTKFVGREREMEALRHAAALARAGH